MLKTIDLPRHARDKHRKSTQKEGGVFLQTGRVNDPVVVTAQGAERNAFCAMPVYTRLKTEHLPRQPRDKHWENCKTYLFSSFLDMEDTYLPAFEAGIKDGAGNAFFARLVMLTMIILPRQARDKHMETVGKRGLCVSQGMPAASCARM